MGCETMLELGVLMSGATVLALVVLSPIFRQPVPPRWTQNGFISEFITVAMVAGFAVGITMSVAGMIALMQTGGDATHLGLMAGVIVLLVVSWRLLRARRGAVRNGGRVPTGTA